MNLCIGEEMSMKQTTFEVSKDLYKTKREKVLDMEVFL